MIGDSNKHGKKGDGKPMTEAPLTIHDIQSEATKFLGDYRRFLNCCAQDTGSLNDLDDLHATASALLKGIQETGLVNMGTSQRGIKFREIIAPIARARDELERLKARVESLAEAKERLGTLSYEEAGREHRRIQQEENTLQNEFRPINPPASAPTGTEIEATTLPNRIGSTIGTTTLPSASGPNIGDVVTPYSDHREDLDPRSGRNIKNTTLPSRYGASLGEENAPASDLPTSTGYEIDSSQGPTGPSTNPARVGPAIGDSSLNSR